MRIGILFSSLMFIQLAFSAPQFKVSTPDFQGHFDFKGAELCATAKETLAYLNVNLFI